MEHLCMSFSRKSNQFVFDVAVTVVWRLFQWVINEGVTGGGQRQRYKKFLVSPFQLPAPTTIFPFLVTHTYDSD